MLADGRAREGEETRSQVPYTKTGVQRSKAERPNAKGTPVYAPLTDCYVRFSGIPETQTPMSSFVFSRATRTPSMLPSVTVPKMKSL